MSLLDTDDLHQCAANCQPHPPTHPPTNQPNRLPACLQVVTFTSDMRGAGTDAGVYVELIDNAGASSGRKSLVTSAPDAFERGKRDEFSITDTWVSGRITDALLG